MDDPLIPVGLGDDFGRRFDALNRQWLSITEWRPLTGALPRMNDAAWLVEFEKYKQIPEYQLQNMGTMSNLNSFTGGNGAIVNWAVSLDWSGRLVLLLNQKNPHRLDTQIAATWGPWGFRGHWLVDGTQRIGW